MGDEVSNSANRVPGRACSCSWAPRGSLCTGCGPGGVHVGLACNASRVPGRSRYFIMFCIWGRWLARRLHSVSCSCGNTCHQYIVGSCYGKPFRFWGIRIIILRPLEWSGGVTIVSGMCAGSPCGFLQATSLVVGGAGGILLGQFDCMHFITVEHHGVLFRRGPGLCPQGICCGCRRREAAQFAILGARSIWSYVSAFNWGNSVRRGAFRLYKFVYIVKCWGSTCARFLAAFLRSIYICFMVARCRGRACGCRSCRNILLSRIRCMAMRNGKALRFRVEGKKH